MSIQALWGKFKGLLAREDVLLSFLILAVAVTAFTIGRYSAGKDVVSLGEVAPEMRQQATPQLAPEPEKLPEASDMRGEVSAPEGEYVASKNGTKYHLPWCSGAKRIKEENKIWFNTKAEAEAAGYEPAANCKGI